MRIWGNYRITAFQIIALGFVLMILIGTLLLMLPVSSRQQTGTEFSDCLFTATSAVCVTGLVVRDTFTHWSAFGQAVILFLIQIGGMGVVTAAISLSFLSGRKIGLMQRSVMQEAISAPQVGGIVRLTKFIVLATAGIELTGSLLLMTAFVPEFGWGKGIWYAVFHAVSAFCNAGFDLMGAHGAFSSMTGYAQNTLVNIVLVLLITIGGIGFLVWNDINEHRFRLKQYRLQSKIVLAASGAMILIPFLWFLVFEMSQAPVGERILPVSVGDAADCRVQHNGPEQRQRRRTGADDPVDADRRITRINRRRNENHHRRDPAADSLRDLPQKGPRNLLRAARRGGRGSQCRGDPDYVFYAVLYRRSDYQQGGKPSADELPF